MSSAPELEPVFPVRYRVEGDGPMIDITIDVAADGTLTLNRLTEASLPGAPLPVRLGKFRGTLQEELLEPVAGWARQILAEAVIDEDVPQPPTSVLKWLSVRGEDPVAVETFGVPPAFEQAVAAAAIGALAQPIAAVEVVADDGAGVLVVRSVGSEPFPVLFFARDIAGYFARVWRDDPAGHGGIVGLDERAVEALVTAGQLAEGPMLLAPGTTVTLPLPPPGEGRAAAMRGNFLFWRTAEGGERRILAGTW